MKRLSSWLRAEPDRFPKLVGALSLGGLGYVATGWFRGFTWESVFPAAAFAILLVLAVFYSLGAE